MEKINLISLFDALKLREHKEKIYKIIDRVDVDIREELRKYLQGETKLKKCDKCFEEKPATTEYFHVNRNYADGLHGYCKSCKNKYDREQYRARKKAEREGKPLERKQTRIAEEGYKRIMAAPKDYGIGDKLHKVELFKGKTYLVLQSTDKLKTSYDKVFEGELVDNHKEHITLKHKLGYRESFRKFDILCGEIKIKEV